jgi:hypothetical protein
MQTDDHNTTMAKRSQAFTLPPPLHEWIITKHNQSSAPSSPPCQRTTMRHNQSSAPSTAAITRTDDCNTMMVKCSQASTLPPPPREWIMTTKQSVIHPVATASPVDNPLLLCFCQAAAKLTAATVLLPPPPLPPRSHGCTSTAYKIKKYNTID